MQNNQELAGFGVPQGRFILLNWLAGIVALVYLEQHWSSQGLKNSISIFGSLRVCKAIRAPMSCACACLLSSSSQDEGSEFETSKSSIQGNSDALCLCLLQSGRGQRFLSRPHNRPQGRAGSDHHRCAGTHWGSICTAKCAQFLWVFGTHFQCHGQRAYSGDDTFCMHKFVF